MKGLVAFVLFTQLVAIAAVLAAAKLRGALGGSGVTTRQFVVIALQLWLPTAIMFALVMNVALEKWELRPMLAIPVLLLALLVPGVAIGSRGPVASVALFTRVPLADITRVALDTSSRTSVALTKVLCAHRFRALH